LSGDFNAPFGRSSHHQVWSEAMVVTPVVRGLLGIEVSAGGKELRFAPQLPANWNHVEVRNVAAGNARFDLDLAREGGRLMVAITRPITRAAGTTSNGANANDSATRLTISPAFPLDARIRSVKVQGRSSKFAISSMGDVQRAEVIIDANQPRIEVLYSFDEGTDVFVDQEIPASGAQSEGLRILRSRADQDALHLVLEGIGGRSYALHVRTPWQLVEVSGTNMKADGPFATRLVVAFSGSADTYVRRELTIPLHRQKR
jgi:hypothetical protein